MIDLDEAHAADALGPDVAEIFIQHTECLSPEAAAELVPLVDVHLEATHKIRASMVPGIDVGLAVRITDACKELLSRYPEMDERCRAAVVGAVRYFMQARDAEADLDSEGGFRDDAQVVNYVIGLTGADVKPVEIG